MSIVASFEITYVKSVDVQLRARTYAQKRQYIFIGLFYLKFFAVQSYAVEYFDSALAVLSIIIFTVISFICGNVRHIFNIEHISSVYVKRKFVSLILPTPRHLNGIELHIVRIYIQRHIANLFIENEIPIAV